MKDHKQNLQNWILILITCMFTQFSLANNLPVVSGKVTSATKEVIPYATVHLKGTTLGCMTDDNGGYSIHAPAGDYTLVVSMMGFSSVEQPVTLANEKRDRKSVV